MSSITLYLGLDVHKDSITIAIAQPGSKGEIRLYGTILNSLQALERALTRIRQAHPGAQLKVAYEAGPCGFVIAWRLKQLKVPCLVAAPSLFPKQPGSPFKTDKRDASHINAPGQARRGFDFRLPTEARTRRRLHPARSAPFCLFNSAPTMTIISFEE